MKNAAKGFVTTLLVSAVAMGMAQTNGPKDFSLRLGAQFPRVGGDTNLAAGVDFKLPQFGAPAARGSYVSYFGLSGDYYGKNDNYNIPLAATYNVRSDQLVFSGGVGIDFSRRFGSSTSGFGAQVAATYEFAGTGGKTGTGAPIFVQAKYFFANQTEQSGFAFYVGVRF